MCLSVFMGKCLACPVSVSVCLPACIPACPSLSVSPNHPPTPPTNDNDNDSCLSVSPPPNPPTPTPPRQAGRTAASAPSLATRGSSPSAPTATPTSYVVRPLPFFLTAPPFCVLFQEVVRCIHMCTRTRTQKTTKFTPPPAFFPLSVPNPPGGDGEQTSPHSHSLSSPLPPSSSPRWRR